MFDSNSRYFDLATAEISVPEEGDDTRTVRYVRRRIIPRTEGSTTLVEHTVTQGERLDQITARYAGDPTEFWRICDANNVLEPEELEQSGRVIDIAVRGI